MKNPLLKRLLIPIVLLLFSFSGYAQIITAFASGIGDCRDAVIYGRFNQPVTMTTDVSGNVYIADHVNNRIRKVDVTTGLVSTILSNADMNLAGAPPLQFVTAMAFDPSGNLYLGYEAYISRIVKVDPYGHISAFAGTSFGFSGDGGAATAASFYGVMGICFDAAGNMYVADKYNNRVRKIGTDGIVNTIAGGNSTLGDGGLAILAGLNNPNGVVVDGAGNIYIADGGNFRLRKINTSGIINTVATGSLNYLTMDPSGNFYTTNGFNAAYKITPSGTVTTFAGGGLTLGNGGPATNALVTNISDIKADIYGNVYILEQGDGRLRRVNTAGIISAAAGNSIPEYGFGGDGGQALFATFNPSAITVDRSGNMFLAESPNQRARKINASGIVSTIAGIGVLGFAGDGGPATSALLGNPVTVATDFAGNVYLGETNTAHVRKINTSGIISSVAGGGTSGLGDGGPALSAQIMPSNITSDSAGNIYISDITNLRIRKVTAATGIITTICGNGTPGSTGDGGPATAAKISAPRGIVTDRAGSVFFADNTAVRRINPAGIITTVAGGGATFIEGAPATVSSIGAPTSVTTDKWGNLYCSDMSSGRVLKVDAIGYLHTVAGSGYAFCIGDCSPATAAGLGSPGSITIDTSGNLFILDGGFVRKVCCMDNNVGNPPIFLHNSPGLHICASSGIQAIDTFLNITDADAGQLIQWSVLTAPAHGSLAGFPHVGISTGGIVTPSGLTYTPAAGFSGTDNFTIKVSDGRYANILTVTVSISPMPTAITGPGTVCAGNDITLSGAGSGGTWSSNNTGIATVGSSSGVVAGISAGTARISYSIGGICSINTIVTVNNAVAPITGAASVCMTVPDTLHCATPGGSWSSSNSSVASIGSSSGIIIPNTLGVDSISYVVSGGCKTGLMITVNPLPDAGVVSGPSSVCATASITMSDAAPGGVWSISNGNAAISSSGSLTGVTAGITTVSYTVTNSCGTANSTQPVIVNPLPSAGAITGPSSFCVGYSIILTNPTALGIGLWSSPDPFIAISSTSGVVTGIAMGTALVSYTASNACGIATTTKVITINAIPWAGTISGVTSVCTGGTSTLSSSVPGGVWSSGNPLVASVNSTGLVSGIASGAAIISYTLSSPGCGASVAFAIVNVAPATIIMPVTGPSAVCVGATAALTDASPGGSWSSSNTSVATVGSTGVVTGISAGVATISYSANLGCGMSVATSNITVQPAAIAGIITGTATICTGASDVLLVSATGGTWSSSNTNVTVSPTGLISGIAVGSSTISYTVINSCGIDYATHTVTAYNTPVPGSITGSPSVCAGSSVSLSDPTGTSGGTWASSSISVATIGSTGIVAGIAAGTTLISYTVTTGCGTAMATKILTVNAPTAGTITGVVNLCAGGSSILSSTLPGGTWASSAPSVVSVSSTGITNALGAGVSVISYSYTGTCGPAITTVNFTVGSLPIVSPIMGVSAMCNGSTATFADVTTDGVWSSSNSSIASVGSTGIVSAHAVGMCIISYNVTAGCGTAGVITTLNVQTIPDAGTIAGSNAICAGTPTIYTASGPGSWSSSNILVATAGSGGAITGIAAGSTTITFTITNTCGSATATKNVTVDVISAGIIAGVSNFCPGNSALLTDTVTGGIWSSGNPAIVSAGSTGAIFAIAPGVAVISYAVTNSCGTAVATHTVNVLSIPNPGIISGPSSLCAGLPLSFSSSSTVGGSWVSSNTALVTIGSTGLSAGISAGIATVSYIVSNACGSAWAVKDVTVNVLTAGVINGITTLCPGGTTALSSTIAGGTWASSAPLVATVGTSGTVTAVTPGNSIITYTVSGLCGTATATANIVVGSLPLVAAITGNTTICIGNNTALSDFTLSGVWSSSNPAIAAVDTAGNVTGMAAGTVVISYMVTAGCGTAGSTTDFTVEDMPDPGTITGNLSICVGISDSLYESITGGVWSSENQFVATIDPINGVLSGITPGTSIISYMVSNTCGAAFTTVNSIVTTVPDAGTITGTTHICQGATTQLQNTITRGSWTSSNPAIAAINSAGIVTGNFSGSADISYSVSNNCGTNNSVQSVTIHPLPSIASIEGSPVIIKGETQVLSNAVTGGVWSTSNTSVVTVNQSGVATGVSVGAVAVTYAVINSFGCSTDTSTILMVINDTGTHTPVNYGFDIYPNPATNGITISWYNQVISNAEIAFFDIAGKEISKNPISVSKANGQTYLGISGLPAAVYTYVIKSVTGTYSGKLVIRR